MADTVAEKLVRDSIAHIRANLELADFEEGASAAEIAEVEQILGVEFPASYKYYLRELGVGDFNGHEFYGIIPGNIRGSRPPSVVAVNEKLRKELNWPRHMVVIYHTGYGPWVCIDCSERLADNERPISVCDPHGNFLERIYANFGGFFHSLILA